MPGWLCYSSEDMKHWTSHGMVLRASDFPNSNPYGAWAAQMVESNGKFYFMSHSIGKTMENIKLMWQWEIVPWGRLSLPVPMEHP